MGESHTVVVRAAYLFEIRAKMHLRNEQSRLESSDVRQGRIETLGQGSKFYDVTTQTKRVIIVCCTVNYNLTV